jgi:two-component system, OmpR family, response regulator MprA
MNTRILLIDDDNRFTEIVQHALVKENYLVMIAEDGPSGLAAFREDAPDLIVLDWILPGMDGLEVCKKLREMGTQPILMLTGREAKEDLIHGLDAGADDYMVKPYETDELLARIRALLRRTQMDQNANLVFADLVLDTASRQASRKGRVIHLTAKEYDLLEMFIKNPRKLLKREEIFDRVWGYDFGGESNVLDVYIRYLRHKLEIKGEPRLIYTVRGIGYILKEKE